LFSQHKTGSSSRFSGKSSRLNTNNSRFGDVSTISLTVKGLRIARYSSANPMKLNTYDMHGRMIISELIQQKE
jgi:hypothetical protein